MKTINDRWKDFASICICRDAGKVQRVECKRMFFAGFAAAFDMMVNDVTQLSDADADKALTSLRKQLLGFNEAVKLGVE